MMASEQFSVSWDNFHKNMNSGMNSLLESEDFVDVTLAVEGRYLKAHKMVLSVCSPYFKELFKTSPCKHPIVFMKDVSYSAMSDLLQFMYKGEVQVSEENFHTFVKTAESLQIRGLSSHENGSAESHRQKTKLMDSLANKTPIPVSKRLRLDASIEKVNAKSSVPETTTATSVSLKTEPYDEDESPLVIAEDSNEVFFDDEKNKTPENENYWIMEGDEVDTKNENLEESTTSDIEEAAAPGLSSVIPEKSKKNYEHAFDIFEQWCNENNVKAIDEDVLMRYFKEKSVNYKSSTLMAYYSMLRCMLSIKKNLDISKYRNLLSFLKELSEGQTAKKSKILKRENFEKFLREANDETFLMKKVAMIIGVAGACRSYELTELRMEHVIDEGNMIRIQLPDANYKITREFIVTAGNIENVNLIEIIRKYIRLRPTVTDHQRFFVSYRLGKCTKQPVGRHTFGSMPKRIAQFLGLANPEQYTGHCFRQTAMLFKKNCFP